MQLNCPDGLVQLDRNSVEIAFFGGSWRFADCSWFRMSRTLNPLDAVWPSRLSKSAGGLPVIEGDGSRSVPGTALCYTTNY